jgi:carboxyl-terminal processing protease
LISAIIQGGSLYEAVNIVNVFIPKGKEVVSTKGKVPDWNKTYNTLNNPLDTEIPIAVLTSGGSASASEIVAGSLQDYDRAILIGQKTFGKGLVQTTRQLAYNAQLKVTTAKYYIPSGRCIQALLITSIAKVMAQ